jgi:hypothetical protein
VYERDYIYMKNMNQSLIDDLEHDPMYISTKDKQKATNERRKANLMELVRKHGHRDALKQRNRRIEYERRENAENRKEAE